MTYDEAKRLLALHSIGIYNAEGQVSERLWDGFVASLERYGEGVRAENFHQVMEALYVVGRRIHSSAQFPPKGARGDLVRACACRRPYRSSNSGIGWSRPSSVC